MPNGDYTTYHHEEDFCLEFYESGSPKRLYVQKDAVITVGGYENFVDEDVYVGDIAYRSGVEVKVDIVAEMQHSFQQICGGCKDADDQIARFAAWARPKLGL